MRLLAVLRDPRTNREVELRTDPDSPDHVWAVVRGEKLRPASVSRLLRKDAEKLAISMLACTGRKRRRRRTLRR